jgi:hypothetical protein
MPEHRYSANNSRKDFMINHKGIEPGSTNLQSNALPIKLTERLLWKLDKIFLLIALADILCSQAEHVGNNAQ